MHVQNDYRPGNLAVRPEKGGHSAIDVINPTHQVRDPIVILNRLTGKTLVELWLGTIMKPVRLDHLPKMFADKVGGGLCVELGIALVGVNVSIIEPHDSDALTQRIKQQLMRRRVVAFRQRTARFARRERFRPIRRMSRRFLKAFDRIEVPVKQLCHHVGVTADTVIVFAIANRQTRKKLQLLNGFIAAARSKTKDPLQARLDLGVNPIDHVLVAPAHSREQFRTQSLKLNNKRLKHVAHRGLLANGNCKKTSYQGLVIGHDRK
ncbi:MAG: hypothetical protein RIA09_09405 [Hoeflea sp.]